MYHDHLYLYWDEKQYITQTDICTEWGQETDFILGSLYNLSLVLQIIHSPYILLLGIRPSTFVLEQGKYYKTIYGDFQVRPYWYFVYVYGRIKTSPGTRNGNLVKF